MSKVIHSPYKQNKKKLFQLNALIRETFTNSLKKISLENKPKCIKHCMKSCLH